MYTPKKAKRTPTVSVVVQGLDREDRLLPTDKWTKMPDWTREVDPDGFEATALRLICDYLAESGMTEAEVWKHEHDDHWDRRDGLDWAVGIGPDGARYAIVAVDDLYPRPREWAQCREDYDGI